MIASAFVIGPAVGGWLVGEFGPFGEFGMREPGKKWPNKEMGNWGGYNYPYLKKGGFLTPFTTGDGAPL